MILGSGLGDYADILEASVRIPFSEIPDFPLPTVPGHTAAIVFGHKFGRDIVDLQGRIHSYEGLSQQEVTPPVWVLAADILPVKLSHEVVTESANKVHHKFQLLIDLILRVICK